MDSRSLDPNIQARRRNLANNRRITVSILEELEDFDREESHQPNIAGRNNLQLGETDPILETEDEQSSEAVDLLSKAATAHNLQAVEQLIKNGLDVNTPDEDGRTALHIAASEDDAPVAQALLQAGARANLADKWGFTPVDYAKEYSSQDMVLLLLNALKISPNIAAYPRPGKSIRTSPTGRTSRRASPPPLRRKLSPKRETDSQFVKAVETGDIELLKRMLVHGANIHAADNNNRNALHIALDRGHNHLVEFLLAAGADPDALDENQQSPADLAEARGNVIGTRLLGKSRHHTPTEDQQEFVAAACSAARDGDLNRLTNALRSLEDVNLGDYDQRTPLHLAASEGRIDCVRLLVEKYFADVNVTDRWGNTPLSEAVHFCHQSVSDYLRKHGAAAPVIAEVLAEFLASPTHKAIDFNTRAFEFLLKRICRPTGPWVLGEIYLARETRVGKLLLPSTSWYYNSEAENEVDDGWLPTANQDSTRGLDLMSGEEQSLTTVEERNFIRLFRKAGSYTVIEPGYGVLGGAFSSRKPMWVYDVATTSQGEYFRAPIARLCGLHGCLASPIVSHGETGDVIGVASVYAMQRLDEDEKETRRVQQLMRSLSTLSFLERALREGRVASYSFGPYRYCKLLAGALTANGILLTGDISTEEVSFLSCLEFAMSTNLFQPVEECATSLSSENHLVALEVISGLCQLAVRHGLIPPEDEYGYTDVDVSETPGISSSAILRRRMRYFLQYFVSASPPTETIFSQAQEALRDLNTEPQIKTGDNMQVDDEAMSSEGTTEHLSGESISPPVATPEEESEPECILCKFNVPGHIHPGKTPIPPSAPPKPLLPPSSEGSQQYFGPGKCPSPVLVEARTLPELLHKEFEQFSRKDELLHRNWEGDRENFTSREIYECIGARHVPHPGSSRGGGSNAVIDIVNNIVGDPSPVITVEQILQIQQNIELEEQSQSGLLRTTPAVGYATKSMYRVFMPPEEIPSALDELIGLLKTPEMDRILRAQDKTITLTEFLDKALSIVEIQESARRQRFHISQQKNRTSTWF